MSNNKLKIIACISMLLDHIGVILLPDVLILRAFGRLAMPIFAFLIGEGCLHTRSRVRYFLSVFTVGVLCQAVYLIQCVLWGGIHFVYLNVMLTFSVSIILAFVYVDVSQRLESRGNSALPKLLLFIFECLLTALVFTVLENAFPVTVEFDYGFAGAILPLFAIVTKEKLPRLAVFSVGLCIMNVFVFSVNPLTWLSLLSIPLISLYNGRRGKRGLKYFFYAFYPLHIAVLYGISLIIF